MVTGRAGRWPTARRAATDGRSSASGRRPDADGARLEAAYRRLLWAYPARVRRSSGLEMLTTLMDAAPVGRRRPSGLEAADLLMGGLRSRLSVPRGPAFILGAAATALIGALLVAASLIPVSWWAVQPPPADEVATAVARIAAPDATLTGNAEVVRLPVGYERLTFARVGSGGADVAPDHRYVGLRLPVTSVPEAADQIHARFNAAGWQVDSLTNAGYQSGFWARQGELVALVTVTEPDVGTAAGPLLGLELHHTVSAGWHVATPAALLGGGLFGWLVGGWGLRRLRTLALRRRLVATAIALPCLGLGAGISMFAVGRFMTAMLSGRSASAPLVPMETVMMFLPLMVLVLAGMLTLAVLVRANRAATIPTAAPTVLRRTTGSEPDDPTRADTVEQRDAFTSLWRTAAWGVSAIHLLFAAAYATIVAIFLIYMSAGGASRTAMTQGQHDPKDVLHTADSALGALAYPVLTILFFFGFLLSPALLTITVPLAIWGRTHLRRSTRVLLTISAASAVLLPIFHFTALGSDIATWWAD